MRLAPRSKGRNPGRIRGEDPPEAPAVDALMLRPVHVPKPRPRTLGLALQIHAFRLRPPLYDVAVPGPPFSWAAQPSRARHRRLRIRL